MLEGTCEVPGKGAEGTGEFVTLGKIQQNGQQRKASLRKSGLHQEYQQGDGP